MNFDPLQETQEEYLRRVSLKDKINNEEWKKHGQEKEEAIPAANVRKRCWTGLRKFRQTSD